MSGFPGESAQTDVRILRLMENVEKVIYGKKDVIRLAVTAMLAGGHVLIEDVPGVGKTQLATALARSVGGSFERLQMTPDVMPSDVIGYTLVRPNTGETEFRKGAVFCHFLLADEINRASPKSQSALLEAMEERQVSIDGNTYPLDRPFMVFATQNPVETYGTYHLPEAQMDRFLMKITMGYPREDYERAILRRGEEVSAGTLEPVLNLGDVAELMDAASKVRVSESAETYILRIIDATRNDRGIRLGASPRGSLALLKASKAVALLGGRDYVLPDDIRFLAPYVLGHRLLLAPSGRSKWADGSDAVTSLLETVTVP
jgi:MoxR-like ATPase